MMNYPWHKIAENEQQLHFEDNDIAVAAIGERKICVGRYRDRLFAFAYHCPHAGGLMADGFIDALGNVACPIHRYKFSLKNGYNVSGEGYCLKHWPVELREDGVYVGGVY